MKRNFLRNKGESSNFQFSNKFSIFREAISPVLEKHVEKWYNKNEGGLPFTILLALLGLFLYTVNPVMLAAAIDAAPKGTESSVTALMFTGPSIFGAMSPVIAGFMRDSWGMDAVFIYASSIVAVVAVLSLVVPMKRVET